MSSSSHAAISAPRVMPARKRVRPSESANIANSLQARSVSQRGLHLMPRRAAAAQRFRGFSLEASLDTHDPNVPDPKLSFIRKKSKIVEIVSAGDILSVCKRL